MTVTVEALYKHFGDPKGPKAVNGVSFTAPEGKVTSLLGPSGSGKSTILRMIAGLEVPSGGAIRIDGAEVTNVTPSKRGIGFVFQGYALFRHMTVFDNVAFGLSLKKVSKSEIADRVDKLLALVRMRGFERRFPGQLSGGQRQRVALARALATDPRVLLLDEPFGALDTKVRNELRDWLAEFHQETRVTTLLVTHDQDEALELSEHVIILDGGRIAQAGSPTDLYDHPANAFVASFLGGSNVISGTVRDGQVSLGGGSVSLSAKASAEEGSQVQAVLRPHELRISHFPGQTTDTGSQAARIIRLVRVGSQVKLLLELPDGMELQVQLPTREVDAKGFSVGDSVLIEADSVKLFHEDFVI